MISVGNPMGYDTYFIGSTDASYFIALRVTFYSDKIWVVRYSSATNNWEVKILAYQ